MRKIGLGLGALLGGLLAAPLVALMYLANQLADLPFVPFDLFDWITRVLPGDLITFGIDLMIDTLRLLGTNVADTAKTAEQASAVLQFLVIGIAAGALFFVVFKWRQARPGWRAGLLMGALFGPPLAAISLTIGQSTASPILNLAWLAFLFLGWGLTLSWATGRLMAADSAVAELAVAEPAVAEPAVADPTPMPVEAAAAQTAAAPTVERINRRQFLIRLGASTATITVVGSGLGAVLAQSERRRLETAAASQTPLTNGANVESRFPNAADPVQPVPGTRSEYTPIADHYKVFLRTEPTVIEEAGYILPITGLVANPLMLTLDDIRQNYESRDQYITLSCISGRIGTTLISTTQWTGVSLQDILADAQVQAGARYLHITSGDGFYETVDLDLINADERIMLCHAWDGKPLPVDHGFPLRIWIPDRYGMKQPKWITEIEVTDEYKEGYWVERNWDEVAQVRTTSVIDTVAVDHIIEDGEGQLVPVGGIAWAGDRQISKVEVRVDGGPWQEAQLRAPLSETTWVLWRYEWPFSQGRHTFEVRCAEGDGTPQIEVEESARPSGATGIHSRKENV